MGSLHMSIAIVEAFVTQSFFLGGKWGQNVKFCFWDPKRHILARNDAILRIDRENRCRGLLCTASPEPPPQKKNSVTVCAGARGGKEQKPLIGSQWNFA